MIAVGSAYAGEFCAIVVLFWCLNSEILTLVSIVPLFLALTVWLNRESERKARCLSWPLALSECGRNFASRQG